MPPTDWSSLPVNRKVLPLTPQHVNPFPDLTTLSPTLLVTMWSPQALCSPLTVHSLWSAGSHWATGRAGLPPARWESQSRRVEAAQQEGSSVRRWEYLEEGRPRDLQDRAGCRSLAVRHSRCGEPSRPPGNYHVLQSAVSCLPARSGPWNLMSLSHKLLPC